MRIKNFLLILLALLFAIAVLGTSVVRATAQTSSNFKITTLTNITPSPTLSPTPAIVDYYLAYPGILPDHFLYPVKMVRDRILLFLTVNPVKKTEVLLLFADKRLGAGKALIEGGKMELGISTLSKAEKYLERAVVQAQQAQKEGKDDKKLYEKLTVASTKHIEVLDQLLLKVPNEAKPQIEKAKEITGRVLAAAKVLSGQ